MQTLSTNTHRANKSHVCSWCMKHINAGELYIVSNNVDGGAFWTFKEHPACSEMVRKLCRKKYMEDIGDGMDHEDFRYAILEYAHEHGLREDSYENALADASGQLLMCED